MKTENLPVYPTHTVYQDCGIDGNSGPHLTETIQHGMTLRQHYAGLAMQAICSNPTVSHATYHLYAEESVKMADALLAELEKSE